ncbi:MAG: DUF998 domain-containing protein [Chloroflexi bacterium]|nr:DUF998 domain-containing protein [Chloroflexota bacterium]
MLRNHAERDSTLRFLALCGVAGPIIFAVLVTVGGFIYEGYSHATQAISELGGVEARYPIIQNANFFVVGILIIALALGLHRGIGGGHGSKLGPLLLGLFGVITTVAQPFLPCDAGCEFKTLTGAMHNLTGLASFLAAVAGIFAISRRLKREPQWHPYQGYSVITSAVALVALIAWIGIAKVAEIGSLNGVLQRTFVGLVLLWIEIMALRMFWVSRRAPTPTTER